MFGVTVQGDDYLDQDEIQATYDIIIEEHQTHFDAFKTVMDKYKEYSKAAVGKTPGGLRMHTHLSRNIDMHICIYVYIYLRGTKNKNETKKNKRRVCFEAGRGWGKGGREQ